jgi:DNA topoisomerase-1
VWAKLGPYGLYVQLGDTPPPAPKKPKKAKKAKAAGEAEAEAGLAEAGGKERRGRKRRGAAEADESSAAEAGAEAPVAAADAASCAEPSKPKRAPIPKAKVWRHLTAAPAARAALSPSYVPACSPRTSVHEVSQCVCVRTA